MAYINVKSEVKNMAANSGITRQRSVIDAFERITLDVSSKIYHAARTKSKSGETGNVLRDLMGRFKGMLPQPNPVPPSKAQGFHSASTDFMAFAKNLKAMYTRPTATFDDLGASRTLALVCASTPTRNVRPKAKYKYAAITLKPLARGRASVVNMISEGIAAIDNKRHNVWCRQQNFNSEHCRFADEAASGNPKEATSTIVFANNLDDEDAVIDMQKTIRDGRVADVMGVDQKKNALHDPETERTIGAGYLVLEPLHEASAIMLNNVPSSATCVVLDVDKIRLILDTLRKKALPAVACQVQCPQHAVFALFELEPDGTILCRINDPNESSVQTFEYIVSDSQHKAYVTAAAREHAKFLKPGSRSIPEDVAFFRRGLEDEAKQSGKPNKAEIDDQVYQYELRLWRDRTYRYVNKDGKYADEFFDKTGGKLTKADGLRTFADAGELADAPYCQPDDDSPGGWCQTWSAFQAECTVLGTTFHDSLVRMASNSTRVEVSPGYSVYATWDEEGKAIANLFAEDPSKLHTVAQDGKTMLEWGCALDAFVRCLAVRYFTFTLGMTSLADDAQTIADAFSLKVPTAHVIL